MKIVEPKVEFITATPDIGKIIELSARNCYKSENSIVEGSDEILFKQVVTQNHHSSVAEHGCITLRVITDRAMLAQITRHRHFSFSVESQRYANYSKEKFGKEVTFIKPFDLTKGTSEYNMWLSACSVAEQSYFNLLTMKVKPETARSVLPNSCKTEIVMTGNVRQWRHFMKLRQMKHAQSDIQHLTQLIYQTIVSNNVPAYLFDDVINH